MIKCYEKHPLESHLWGTCTEFMAAWDLKEMLGEKRMRTEQEALHLSLWTTSSYSAELLLSEFATSNEQSGCCSLDVCVPVYRPRSSIKFTSSLTFSYCIQREYQRHISGHHQDFMSHKCACSSHFFQPHALHPCSKLLKNTKGDILRYNNVKSVVMECIPCVFQVLTCWHQQTKWEECSFFCHLEEFLQQ